MAGLGGMPYYIQDLGQLQQQAAQKQQMQLQQQEALQRQAILQQQQQDRQRQMAAANAAGNVLPQMFLPPPPSNAQQSGAPPQQPPMPGQPSQPMVQPGAQRPQGMLPPPPQGMPQGQPPMPQGGGTPPQGMPQQPPPYRPMPTSPPAPPSQGGAIAPPPQAQQAPQQQPGPLSFEHAVKLLSDQGLKGADLMAGLQQLQPLLDTQAKIQAAQIQQQFTNEVKLQQLQNARDNLEEKRREADQRAKDRSLDRIDRERAHADSMAMRQESIAIRKQMVGAGAGDDAKFTPEDLKFLAEQARAGDTSVYQNLGRGAQGAKNIIALRREVMKQTREAGGSGADVAAANVGYQGEKAGARTAGTKATNVELAAAEAQKTFPLVKQASAALPRTEFVPANRALQAAQTNTGDPRVIALGTAINTSINAYARAISPSGTPTVHDKEHARELLSTANTPDQLNAVLDMMNKEMTAARRAPKEVMNAQKSRISGRAPEDETPAIPSGWSVKEH